MEVNTWCGIGACRPGGCSDGLRRPSLRQHLGLLDHRLRRLFLLIRRIAVAARRRLTRTRSWAGFLELTFPTLYPIGTPPVSQLNAALRHVLKGNVRC